MIYLNEKHEINYKKILEKMRIKDCYHKTTAYLLTLDCVLSEHIADVFDFEEDVIKPNGLLEGWQTGTSKKTTRLMFNLWNDYVPFNELKDPEDNIILDAASRYTVSEIFCCSYARYYWEAIQIRFEIKSEVR